MAHDYIPRREADFLVWSANLRAKLSASPELYGVSPPLAAHYTLTQQAFADAYHIALAPAMRTAVTVADKNVAMKALDSESRMLAAIIRANPDVTDGMRAKLGLSQKAIKRKVVPSPARAPVLMIDSVRGRTVTLRLIDAETNRPRRPSDVTGATVLCFVGEDHVPPTDRLQWHCLRQTSRTKTIVTFPRDLPPGALLWLSAYWTNSRAQGSPASAPICTSLLRNAPTSSDAAKTTAESELKIAA